MSSNLVVSLENRHPRVCTCTCTCTCACTSTCTCSCSCTCTHRPRHPHGRCGRTALAARAGRAIGRTAAARYARAALPPAGAVGDATWLPRAGAAYTCTACAPPRAHGMCIRTACAYARHVHTHGVCMCMCMCTACAPMHSMGTACALQHVLATRLATRRVAGGVPAHRRCTGMRGGATHFHRGHAAGLLPLPATRPASICGARPAPRCAAVLRARVWADRRHGEWRPPLQHTHRG